MAGLYPLQVHMALTISQRHETVGWYPIHLKQTCSNSIWDSVNASFNPCFLPYVSILPAAVGVLILIFHILRPFYMRWRFDWMKRFVEECPELEGEQSDIADLKSSHNLAMGLLVISLIGLCTQLLIFFSSSIFPAVLMAVSWVIAVGMISISRPRTTPFSLIALYVSIFTAQAISMFNGLASIDHVFLVKNVPRIGGLLMCMAAIATSFNMPMRNPRLTKQSISRPFSPSTSKLQSPEDDLTLWQWMSITWMSPLIALGKKRQLNDEDIWLLGWEFQHRRLHEKFRSLHGSVIVRLLVANGMDLVMATVLGVIEMLANFAVPVLLQLLLQSMENKHAPIHAAITYAILSLVVRLIAAQTNVLSLWLNRRAYERSRGEMIMMLYEKTLNRKIIGAREDLHRPEHGADQNGKVTGAEVTPHGWNTKVLGFLNHMPVMVACCFKRKFVPKEVKHPASLGKILNLMRNDVYEIAQRFWEVQALVTKPLGFVISLVLIWRLVGWSSLVGILTVLLAQFINVFVTRALIRWEKLRRLATDVRLQVSSEFVEALRHLRWYGWQGHWLQRIMKSRQHELNLRIITGLWSILISFTNAFASAMFPVTVFYAYTKLAGQPLRIDIAFPALQLFTMLESNLKEIPALITVLINANVAIGRIEAFMQEPDKASANGLPDKNTTSQPENSSTWKGSSISISGASFAWPGTEKRVLSDISLTIPKGLTLVSGEVAAGKTALLQALLGELDQLDGHFKPIAEMVGYCAQTPWLQSMSIRDNILFCSPYQDTRYKQVLQACALTFDLSNFRHGDLSNIGENGIGLSGGQKARVALARALYSSANVLLLDDPLSALDQDTASSIVQNCFNGPLIKDRAVVLVTHRTDLCRGLSTQIIQVIQGKVQVIEEERHTAAVERIESTQNQQPEHEVQVSVNTNQTQLAVPEKFIEDEHRVHGGVQARVYWEFIKAGKLKWWALAVFFVGMVRLIAIIESWFLQRWGEAYQMPIKASLIRDFFDRFPSPEQNVTPWIVGFFVLAAAQSIFDMTARSLVLVVIYTAGRRMFKDVMNSVAHATFRFYDVTPVGRLMNRLTSDIGTVDGNISTILILVAWFGIAWLFSVVVIASITPTFVIFMLALTIVFVYTFLRFLPASQSLRRLEMVSLSPLMSNFGALLNGLTTVRAFHAQVQFQDRVISVVDTFQKMDHFYWSLQAWLMYRFEALSACATLVLTLLAILTGISPGLTAFVLTAAENFVTSTHQLCRQYGQLQMDFVSVERIIELLHVDQEAKGSFNPPASWPGFGSDIIFEDVTIRYAAHLDPALVDVSLRIPGGCNTAIIGRTGSGKSTLALSVLATMVPESGRILIQGIDICSVDKQDLRSRITFLAQDPVLFPGSMRQNLDPLDEYSDEACKAVLTRVCDRHQWTLSTSIDAGGVNLSQGQRQLIGLARAVLRRSPIVILDEATASIDLVTSAEIQQILREEMSECTVLTIAHRLEAVVHADFCVVLDAGRIHSQGPAHEMLKRKNDELSEIFV